MQANCLAFIKWWLSHSFLESCKCILAIKGREGGVCRQESQAGIYMYIPQLARNWVEPSDTPVSIQEQHVTRKSMNHFATLATSLNINRGGLNSRLSLRRESSYHGAREDASIPQNCATLRQWSLSHSRADLLNDDRIKVEARLIGSLPWLSSSSLRNGKLTAARCNLWRRGIPCEIRRNSGAK